MKTKLRFFKPFLTIMLTFIVLVARAQVGGLTQTGNMTVCQGSTESFGVIPTAGSSYQWTILAGTGGTGTLLDGPAPNNLVSVFWTGPGTCTLQVIETIGTCSGIPVNIEVTVLPGLLPGTASGDQTICYNTLPDLLIATPPAGESGNYTYQWEFSVDAGVTWGTVSGATGLTFQPGALIRTTHYRLQQSSAGGCGSVNTNQVVITVQPEMITSPIYHR